jgi:hypothetical protein
MPGCQRQRRDVSPQYLRSTARLLTQAPARCRYGAPDIPRWAGADSGVAESAPVTGAAVAAVMMHIIGLAGGEKSS